MAEQIKSGSVDKIYDQIATKANASEVYPKQTVASSSTNGILLTNMNGTVEFGVNNDGNGFYFRLYTSNGVSYRFIVQTDHGYIQKFNGSSWETWRTLY